MSEDFLVDRLEQAIQRILTGREVESVRADADVDAGIVPLITIAHDLRDLPRARFRAQLKADLERSVSMTTVSERVTAARQTATPSLRVRNAVAAIKFYEAAFGARELMRFAGHGRVAHAELAIGNSIIILGEEAPEHGFPSPDVLGGSPVTLQLYVDDVDALVRRAVAAGARLVSPVRDQFYGDRSGHVADPFGYGWTIATRKEDLSVEEMHRRFEAIEGAQPGAAAVASVVPEGFRAVTPYLVVQDAPGLIDFVKRAFDAEERHRSVGSAGGVHAEVRIGDSVLMLGGGAPDLSWRGTSRPTALHLYVKDVDAVFERAVEAGATPSMQPVDQEYGERSGGVTDASGNHWYIATAKGEHYVPEGLHTVNVYLHPLRAEPLIAFLRRAFDAETVAKYASPDGVVHHARVRIGDAVIEMGEAHGPYQPMPTMFYVYVPNVDASYRRALEVGATSISEPADQAYGNRTAGVEDAFGNQWYLAAPISEGQ